MYFFSKVHTTKIAILVNKNLSRCNITLNCILRAFFLYKLYFYMFVQKFNSVGTCSRVRLNPLLNTTGFTPRSLYSAIVAAFGNFKISSWQQQMSWPKIFLP